MSSSNSIFSALRAFGKGMADAPVGSSVAQRFSGGGGALLRKRFSGDDNEEEDGQETDSPMPDGPTMDDTETMRRRRAITSSLGSIHGDFDHFS